MTRFLPGRHLIDAFGNGGFRFGGMSHQGSILILPSGVRALVADGIDAVSTLMISGLSEEREEIDYLIIGSGRRMQRPEAAIWQWLLAQRFNPDVMDTHAAVRTYNVVAAEERRVAAVMIAVTGHA